MPLEQIELIWSPANICPRSSGRTKEKLDNLSIFINIKTDASATTSDQPTGTPNIEPSTFSNQWLGFKELAKLEFFNYQN